MADPKAMTGFSKLRDVWERQVGESEQAYRAFALYRDMGDERSHAKLQTETGKNRRVIEKWSHRDHWIFRVKKYDEMVEEVRSIAIAQKKKEMMVRQARLGENMQLKASEGLDSLEVQALSAHEVAKLAEVGVKIERQAYGEHDESSAGNLGVQIVFNGPAPSWAPTGTDSVAVIVDEDKQLTEGL